MTLSVVRTLPTSAKIAMPPGSASFLASWKADNKVRQFGKVETPEEVSINSLQFDGKLSFLGKLRESSLSETHLTHVVREGPMESSSFPEIARKEG